MSCSMRCLVERRLEMENVRGVGGAAIVYMPKLPSCEGGGKGTLMFWSVDQENNLECDV